MQSQAIIRAELERRAAAAYARFFTDTAVRPPTSVMAVHSMGMLPTGL